LDRLLADVTSESFDDLPAAITQILLHSYTIPHFLRAHIVGRRVTRQTAGRSDEREVDDLPAAMADESLSDVLADVLNESNKTPAKRSKSYPYSCLTLSFIHGQLQPYIALHHLSANTTATQRAQFLVAPGMNALISVAKRHELLEFLAYMTPDESGRSSMQDYSLWTIHLYGTGERDAIKLGQLRKCLKQDVLAQRSQESVPPKLASKESVLCEGSDSGFDDNWENEGVQQMNRLQKVKNKKALRVSKRARKTQQRMQETWAIVGQINKHLTWIEESELPRIVRRIQLHAEVDTERVYPLGRTFPPRPGNSSSRTRADECRAFTLSYAGGSLLVNPN